MLTFVALRAGVKEIADAEVVRTSTSVDTALLPTVLGAEESNTVEEDIRLTSAGVDVGFLFIVLRLR